MLLVICGILVLLLFGPKSEASTQSLGNSKSTIASAETNSPRIEVCFVLDTTSSMTALIESAKQKIWSLANQMVKGKPTPEVKVGLVAFRDRGDE